MITFDKEMIDRIAVFFPDAIRRAFDDYEDFITGPQDDKAIKDTSDRTKVQKAIIAHVQLLVKLWDMLVESGMKLPDLAALEANERLSQAVNYRVVALREKSLPSFIQNGPEDKNAPPS